MSSKKTEVETKKNNNIYFLIILLLLIGIGIVVMEIKSASVYQVEPRTDEVKANKANDNEDKKTVAWLRVQGTNIDLPVLYAPDYNFAYETANFAWTEADYKNLNNIIYISGHNIKNMSANPEIASKDHDRFEQLMSFAYYDFAKDNQFIQYTFKGEDYLYRIYSVDFIDEAYVDMFNDSRYSKQELKKFINTSLKKSVYKYDVEVDENDDIISLNTCTSMFGDNENIRIIVNGRLVRDEEEVKLAEVQTTKQYKTIENLMKGGDSDEEI